MRFREVKSLASSLTAETHRWESWKLNPNRLPPESACLNAAVCSLSSVSKTLTRVHKPAIIV